MKEGEGGKKKGEIKQAAEEKKKKIPDCYTECKRQLLLVVVLVGGEGFTVLELKSKGRHFHSKTDCWAAEESPAKDKEL